MQMDDIPEEDLDRVSIKKYANSISVVSTSKKTVIVAPQSHITHTFGDIDLATPKRDWFMRHLKSSFHTDRLRAAILEGKAYAVSN